MNMSSRTPIVTPSAVSRALPLALAGLAALAVALGVGRFLLTPMLPLMRQDEGVGLVLGGWLAAVTNTGYLIGALSCLVIRAPRATMLVRGLLLVALGTLAMVVSRQPLLWLTLRFLVGIGSGWVMVYAAALITPQLQRLGLPVLEGPFYAGVGIGIVVTGVGTPWLAGEGIGSAGVWAIFGVLSLLLVPIIRRPTRHAERDLPAHEAALGGRLPAGTTSLVLSYALIGFGYAIPATFLPLIARELLHSPLLADRLWPIYGIASAVVTVLLPLLHNRLLSNRAMIAICQLSMLSGSLLCVLSPDTVGVAAAAVLNGGVLMLVVLFVMREAHRIAPRHATALVAWLTGAFGIGQISGPLVAGYLAGRGGSFTGALLLAVAALMLGVIVVLRPLRRFSSILPGRIAAVEATEMPGAEKCDQ